MKLYTTTTSDKGKAVNKGGNEFIHVIINDEDRENILSIHVEPKYNKIGEYMIEIVNYKQNYINVDHYPEKQSLSEK